MTDQLLEIYYDLWLQIGKWGGLLCFTNNNTPNYRLGTSFAHMLLHIMKHQGKKLQIVAWTQNTLQLIGHYIDFNMIEKPIILSFTCL